MIPYSKRKETSVKREAWIPKDLDAQFRNIIPNYQAWVIQKIKDEIEKAAD